VRIAVGADHAGFPLKAAVLGQVRQLGHEGIDLGTHDTSPVDYPDVARAVGEAITRGAADRGILLCGSGIGACVAANKMRGIMAGVCHDAYSARQGVEHDAMNVLTLGARVIGPALVPDLVHAFLGATFTGEERHVRRLAKVYQLEAEAAVSPPAAMRVSPSIRG
jgi:ribose 5-phosphate isomerase B